MKNRNNSSHVHLYQICNTSDSIQIHLLTSKFNLYKLLIFCPKSASSFAYLTPCCTLLTFHNLCLFPLVEEIFIDIQEFTTFNKNLGNVLTLQTDYAKVISWALLLFNHFSEIKLRKRRNLPTPLWASTLVNSSVPLWPFLGFS